MINNFVVSGRVLLCALVGVVCLDQGGALAQNTSYPDPVTSSGMSRSYSGSLTARERELMQVRSEAAQAQGQAAAATMSRSIDRQIQEQNYEQTLQSAREIKALKRQVAERHRWEQANQRQVNKVTAEQMSSWNTERGGVRVERNVPAPFLSALIEEEQAAIESGEQKVKKGFKPFRSMSSAGANISNPFQRRSSDSGVYSEPEAATNLPASQPSGGGGFFSKLKVPTIGAIGGRSQAVEEVAPADAEPQFDGTSSSRRSSRSQPKPAPAPAVKKTKPGVVPRISGAELVDGRPPVNHSTASESSSSTASSSNHSAAPAAQSASPTVAPPPADKPSFFSKFKSESSAPVASNSGGGGFLGFGKKKGSSSGQQGVDAGLFPAGSVAQAPTGGELQGGYSVEDVSEQAQGAGSSTGSFALPGQEREKKSGFSFPKPTLGSLPGAAAVGSVTKKSSVPTLTTINSAGNDHYVVTGNAQFLIYGEDGSSEVRALQPGTVVRMTQPGEKWASISLPSGETGIVQNASLRGASSSEVGLTYAPSN